MKNLLLFCLLLTTGVKAQSVLTVLPSTAIVNNTMNLGVYATQQTVTDNAKSDKVRIDSCSNAIKGMSGGGSSTWTRPVSITVTYSQTLPSNFNYDGAIYMDCNGCTVTLPAAQKDWHWKIYNIYKGFGSTGAYIRTTGAVSTVNSVTSIAKNSRPFDIQYITSTLVTIK